ncbi:MAG: hypothetical protein ACREVK_01465 [Gammaproteobacteria bacterium]
MQLEDSRRSSRRSLPAKLAFASPYTQLSFLPGGGIVLAVNTNAISIIGTLSFLLSGCAWQSEAMKVGPDTYQTSANASPVRGGATGAREMALANANKKCESLGKQIEVIDTKGEYAFPANGVFSVTFRCN